MECLSALLTLEVDSAEDQQADILDFSFAALTSEVDSHMLIFIMLFLQIDTTKYHHLLLSPVLHHG